MAPCLINALTGQVESWYGICPVYAIYRALASDRENTIACIYVQAVVEAVTARIGS